jgi:hypothetical protein
VEGWYWGNIYQIPGHYCLLEILTSTDHLSPPECNRHLVIRTPTMIGMIFWIKKNYREFGFVG